jgi:hypothetical protein
MTGIRTVVTFCIIGACVLTFSCAYETPTSSPTQTYFEDSQISVNSRLGSLWIKIIQCWLDLSDIESAIDRVTPQTPPDELQIIINEFEELRITHLSLNSRYAELEKSEKEAIVSYNTSASNSALSRYLTEDQKKEGFRWQLKENEKLIEKLSVRIQRTKERYSVGRHKWEKQKSKYEEHLVKYLQEAGVAEEFIYTDSKVVVCINSVVMMSDSISVIVGAYLTEPPNQKSTSGFLMWNEHMRGTLAFSGFTEDYVKSRIFAYGMDGASLGFPISTKLNRLPMINGVVMALTYEGKQKNGTGSLKLVIEQSAFNSKSEIQFGIPSDKIVFVPDTATVVDHVADSTVDDALDRLPKRLEVIQCQREGMHLKVPTELNIHGFKIKTDMLLDTGASFTVISKQLYSKGQTIPTGKLQKQRIQTANGLIECPIDILEVSTTAYARKVEVAIVDDCDPLLGANYFDRHAFTVDLDNQCIYIHPSRE